MGYCSYIIQHEATDYPQLCVNEDRLFNERWVNVKKNKERIN